MTNTRETPVSFSNRDGLRLFGILHLPERPRSDGRAILLLSPGVKGRVAPHRMYWKMARRFAALGFPVLRFDFYGLGDSEGSAPEPLLADFYGQVQGGRFVPDTIAAMDWMEKNHGCGSFIAAGLCGGALTGLLAAERDARIEGLLGLSIPVILDGSAIDFSKFMTDKQLAGTRQRYLGKLRLWDPSVWKSWARLLTFRSHYSLLLRSLRQPFARTKTETTDTASPPPADNTNPLFARALTHFVESGRRMLLVFAETDRLWFEYDAKFVQRNREWLVRHGSDFNVHVTPQANHIFSFAEWQQDMLDESCRWLLQEYPARGVERGSGTAAGRVVAL